MSPDPSDTLAKIPLFQGLDKKHLKRLGQSLKSRTFREGQRVTQEGETGVGFFVIVDGTAGVEVHGEARRNLGPGDHFGEIAMIAGGHRTATITALTDLQCLGMTQWEFKPFVAENPDASWSIMQTLAQRLTEVESQIAH
jgi:CRP-like cAMP-binding protein